MTLKESIGLLVWASRTVPLTERVRCKGTVISWSEAVSGTRLSRR